MASPWVPHQVDVDKWTKHFKLMAAGKLRPNHNGMWIVGDHQGGQAPPSIKLNYVTPTADAVARAQSEMKRQRQTQKSIRGRKKPVKRVGKSKPKKATRGRKKPVKKPGKPKPKKPIKGKKTPKDSEKDIFTR